MSASIRALSLDEFLDWERAQPLRYEFDDTQPIAMTGAFTRHERLVARIIVACGTRLHAGCEVFGSGLKIITAARVRYPDASIACGAQDDGVDSVIPTLVFEIASPSTALTDRRVKSREYREVSSIQAYVIVSQDTPELVVFRKSAGWIEENLTGTSATLELPEVGIEIPLAELYR